MRRWLALIGAALIAVATLETTTVWRGPAATGPAAIAGPLLPPVPYPPDYRTALADTDRAVTTAKARAAGNSSWLAEEMLASAQFERARLTGSLEDYAATEQALARSLALAPPGSGPHLLYAAFHLSVHRLDQAEAKLDQFSQFATPPAAHDRAQVEAMRGDIAFYRGRYAEALRRYDLADRFSPGTSGLRRANFLAAKGDVRGALLALDGAERDSGRRTVLLAARTELQRGMFTLEEGAVDRARAHFERADSLFPGDWRIEEHVAETLALSGEREQAVRRYRDIVARTDGPEFMDQLARLARQQNDLAEAQSWTRRAGQIWQRRLSLFPEAFYAEAAEHCLAAGNFTCALRLARLNYRARPYGEAGALLGEALARGGREREARSILTTLDRSGWRSARTGRLARLLATRDKI